MKLNKRASLYIGVLSILSIFILGFLFNNFDIPSIKMLLFWSTLTIIVETLLIMLPNDEMGVSVGSAINLASIIVGGPLLGVISASLGFLFRFPYVASKGRIHLFNTPFYITIFNTSQSIIGTALMGLVYIYTGGEIGMFYLLQAIFILLLGMIINTFTISGLMSIIKKQDFTKTWIINIKATILSSLAVGVLGVIISIAFIDYGYGAVILLFGPLLLARYSFKMYANMRSLHISAIKALSKTIAAKDRYTGDHASRVKEYSVLLSKEIGLSEDKIQNIETAAILHDIGKIAINDSILNKIDKLTSEEYIQIMEHPIIGANIIGELDFFKDIKDIVKYHHERYDGNGYPAGLKGDAIPIEACILAIADSYDAMTSDRPYRKALDKEAALEEIRKNASTQFHPQLALKFAEKMAAQMG